MQKDDRVFLMGEDVGAYGGTYAVSKGLLAKYGPERIRDTPLSELGFTGIGIGAALGGLRPIVEIMTVNFSLLALDQIVNSAAVLHHMSGGQFNVPLVIRMTTGGGRQLAAQHSNSLEGWYAHIPGLKILTPGTVEDARYMLAQALEDPNPVLLFEHAMLLNREEDCPETAEGFDAWHARIRMPGTRLSHHYVWRHAAARARSGGDAQSVTAWMSKCSTCAACDRWTMPRSSPRCAKPTVP